MKQICKNVSMTFILGVLSFLSVQAQNSFKERFIHQFGFSLYTDYYRSNYTQSSADYITYDQLGNEIQNPIEGVSNSTEISFLSFYYTPRINLYEKETDFSLGLDIPIGVHLNGSEKNFQGSYKEFSGSTSYPNLSILYLGSVSVPIYLTFNFGVGSTYNCIKDRGLSLGVGLDTRIFGFQEVQDSYGDVLNVEFQKVAVMPGIMVAYRYWRNDKAKEIKLKMSYAVSKIPSELDNDNLALKNGLALSLSFNRFLNF